MPVEITYEQYQASGGRLPEAAFGDSLRKAVADVDHIIGPNAVTDEGKYREAVFAAVDVYANSNPAGAGFSIGTFKMDGTGSARTNRANAIGAAYEVLATTGMAYAGVG